MLVWGPFCQGEPNLPIWKVSKHSVAGITKACQQWVTNDTSCLKLLIKKERKEEGKGKEGRKIRWKKEREAFEISHILLFGWRGRLRFLMTFYLLVSANVAFRMFVWKNWNTSPVRNDGEYPPWVRWLVGEQCLWAWSMAHDDINQKYLSLKTSTINDSLRHRFTSYIYFVFYSYIFNTIYYSWNSGRSLKNFCMHSTKS